GVAWPQLAADRSPLAVEHGADDHLLLVGAMVLAVAVLAQALTAFALKVQRGGVEKDHVQLAEQVTAAGEQLLLDGVLGGAQYEFAGALLLLGRQFLAEPGH